MKEKEKHFDQKITFLVNSSTYLSFKIALLELHRDQPEKYPATNPSLAFRRLMLETIDLANQKKDEK